MSILTSLTQTMPPLLTSLAEAVAKQTGFLQRRRKLTGAQFVQTLVFGWLAAPEATLEELAQTAAALGTAVSPQALDQRFTPQAAACLRGVLDAALEQLVAADPVALPLLERFAGLYLLDSSTVRLPDELAQIWPGCGGRVAKNTQAAVKLQVRWDFKSGALEGPQLEAGRAQDKSTPLLQEPLPAGALQLADLGYFSLQQLAQLDRQGVYWLSRLKVQCQLYDAQGQRSRLAALLQAQRQDRVELSVALGAQQRLPCRLLAVRVSSQEANRRRRQIRKGARREGKTPSRQRLALADWNIWVTNAPAQLLSLEQALVLGRTRWQIELLFKLWKSQGRIDKWRSQKPWRILCEVYAKLLAMLLQHWMLLLGCWPLAGRSLSKGAKTVQRHALAVAMALAKRCRRRLVEALRLIERCLAVGCRINKRKTKPHTYQLLLQVCPGGLT